MVATVSQLKSWAGYLENQPGFRRAYDGRLSYGARRNLISQYLAGTPGSTIEDREQLRRYFDSMFGISPDPEDSTYDKYAHLPTLLLLQDAPNEPKPKKGRSAMDRNLAALLRSDAKTIGVVFAGPNKTTRPYTYVTHLPVKVDDFVVVDAAEETKIGRVVRVDDEVKIEPGSDTEYKWVISVVDMVAHQINEKRNAEIVAEAAEIVRNNMRRSFAQQVLGAASEEQRLKLLALTGNTV